MKLRFNKINKQRVLNALWDLNSNIEQNGISKIQTRTGICTKIQDYFIINDYTFVSATQVSDFLYHYWIHWTFFSGNSDYPIPGACRAYRASEDDQLWTGEQGEYRIQLIQFLIQQISKDLNI